MLNTCMLYSFLTDLRCAPYLRGHLQEYVLWTTRTLYVNCNRSVWLLKD